MGVYSEGLMEIQRNEERDDAGKVRHRYQLIDGVLDGESLMFDSDGWLLQRAQFKTGHLDGELVQYAAPDVLSAVLQYHRGKLEGAGTYYDRGKPRVAIHYRDGVQDGETILFGDNGLPTSKAEYKAGKLDGLSSWYRPDGTLLRTAEYVDGLLEGEMVDYDERGRVSERMIFHADELQERIRYKDGKAVREPAVARK